MSPSRKAPVDRLGKAVAAELRAIRARKGVTQTELEAATGISQSQLSKQFRGIRAINIDELDEICAALEIPLAELIAAAESAIGRSTTDSSSNQFVSGASVSSLHDRAELVERINAGLEPVAAQEATEPLEENQP